MKTADKVRKTETPLKPESKIDTLFVKSQEMLLQGRIASLGLVELAPSWSTDLKEKIIDSGAAIDKKRKKEKLAKLKKASNVKSKTEASDRKVEAKAHSDKVSSASSAFNRLGELTGQVSQLSFGSINVGAESITDFVDESIEQGKQTRAEKKAKGSAEKDESVTDTRAHDAKGSRVVSVLRGVREFNSGFYTVLAERVAKVYDEALEHGKVVDLEQRRRAEINRQQRRLNRQKLIARLGFVSHNDIELEGQASDNPNRQMSLERRSKERRSALAAINYDLRVFSRREYDRKAA
jgi:hypothetical protein